MFGNQNSESISLNVIPCRNVVTFTKRIDTIKIYIIKHPKITDSKKKRSFRDRSKGSKPRLLIFWGLKFD